MKKWKKIVEKKAEELIIGDYVLASKYKDGDIHDMWCIGFYNGNYDHCGQIRHLVIDANGQSFRRNGFRKAKRISMARGAFILKNINNIQLGRRNIWYYTKVSMKSFERKS